MSETIKSYKGFDKDLKCRGFQYEIGKEYEHDGPVEACKSGFHACEAPLDVFAYYAPATSRYCEVEQSGELSRDGDNSKIASSRIKIGAEIGIPGLVKAQIEWVKNQTHEIKGSHATGYQGAASATGDYCAASATGNQGAASATGDYCAASATGYKGAASATGYQGAASATGDYGAASATGYQGAASATGGRGAASATGYKGAASATGNQGAASATGYQGAASATGNQGAASATGYQGAASATGDYCAASATGYQGAASATGDYCAASATGKDGVAMACGYEGKVKGALGNAMFLVERGEWNGDTHPILNVAAFVIDGDTYKPNTWYTLKGGKIVEAGDNG